MQITCLHIWIGPPFKKKTIKAKWSFEQDAKSYGNIVQIYHADNSHFVEHTFREELHMKNQDIYFAAWMLIAKTGS